MYAVLKGGLCVYVCVVCVCVCVCVCVYRAGATDVFELKADDVGRVTSIDIVKIVGADSGT